MKMKPQLLCFRKVGLEMSRLYILFIVETFGIVAFRLASTSDNTDACKSDIYTSERELQDYNALMYLCILQENVLT